MTVTTDELRLDQWLVRERGISRNAAQTMLAAGLVTVNGRLGRPGQRVRETDAVVVLPGEVPAKPGPAGRADDLRVVYEDDWLAVVEKPAGMVVHPAPGHAGDTLADALKARGATWSLLGGEERAGIVHRLDRDTSGLLVVAKTEAAHRTLAAQLQERTLGRAYWAVVHGGFRERTGTVEAPIGRDPRDRKRMAVVDHGRPAITDFRVVERLGDMSLLEVTLRSGRTHQIRVHMAYIRHPVAGDSTYGRKQEAPHRPALHATRLTFVHPEDGGLRTFTSDPPPELIAFLDSLRARER